MTEAFKVDLICSPTSKPLKKLQQADAYFPREAQLHLGSTTGRQHGKCFVYSNQEDEMEHAVASRHRCSEEPAMERDLPRALGSENTGISRGPVTTFVPVDNKYKLGCLLCPCPNTQRQAPPPPLLSLSAGAGALHQARGGSSMAGPQILP